MSEIAINTAEGTEPTEGPEEFSLEVFLSDVFTEQSYSPYALSVVVNKVRSALSNNNTKNLPPQMFYQYVANNMISASGNKGDKGRKVSRESAIEWTTKYITKNLANLITK